MSLAWGGFGNGHIPRWALSSVGGKLMHIAAAFQWRRLAAAYKKATGLSLTITEAYRDYARQQYLYYLRRAGKYPYTVAYPGTSNHGWGRALDIGGYSYVGSYPWRWLLANAPRYGWSWTTGRASGEPWHWEYVGSLSASILTGVKHLIEKITRKDDLMASTAKLFYDKKTRVGYLRDLDLPGAKIRCLGLVTQANYKIQSHDSPGLGLSTSQISAQVEHHGIIPETAEYIGWLRVPKGAVAPPVRA